MKKEEYLNRITQELKQYDKIYVDEIISDYEEHFREGMELGQSEEEICGELGNVEDVIEEIKEQMEGKVTKEFELARPVAEMVKAEKKAVTGIKNIYFSAGSSDVSVKPSEDGKFHIYTEDESDMEYVECSVKGDSYYGRVNNRRGFGFQKFLFGIGMGLSKITILVPDGLEIAALDCTHGDVKIKNIRCRELMVNSISGDFRLSDAEIEKIKVSSISGDQKFKRIKFDTLEEKSTSGDVTLKDVCGMEFYCNKKSGDVCGKNTDIKEVYIKSVSGDTFLEGKCYSEPFYVYAKATSGDIRVKNGTRVSESELESPDLEGKVKVSVKSVSGDIKIKGV